MTYWVVVKDEYAQASLKGPSRRTQFEHYTQAEIYKVGLESLNPGKEYVIMRTVPEKHEKVSLFTNEKEQPAPFGYN